MKESDLFIYLKGYFEINPNNELFTEVLGLEGGRPDIVIRTNKKIITVVEMKRNISLDLLEQAVNWRYKANYIYIAIPKPKNERINRFARKLLMENGVGVFFIDMPSEYEEKYLKSGEIPYGSFVSEKIKPKFFRSKKDIVGWSEALKDIYRCENNIIGGTKGGGYNTPYKAMIVDVKRYIHRKGNEFISLTELIERLSSIKTHYSNPKASLHSALVSIEDKQFEIKTEKKQVFFRLTEEAYDNYDVYSW